MLNKKMWIAFTCLIILGLLLAGCAGPPGPVEEDIFICALTADLGTMDPQKIGCFGEFPVHVFSTINIPNFIDWREVPYLALSWENIDPLTWKYTLRQGVRFHNGQTFTSADVQYSFYRQMGKYDPNFPAAYGGILKALIDEIETPDDYTVIFHTKYPEVSFPTVIHWVWIVPKAYIEQVGDDEFAQNPVGTGPYKFVAREVMESITLEANEDYWNTDPLPGTLGPPTVKRVIYRIIPEEATRIAALKAGEVDAIDGVSADSAAELEKDPNIKVYYVPRNQPWFIFMNWRAEKDPDTGEPNPFRDKRVRQAMNYALDIDAIIENYMTGHEYRTTLVGKDAIGYNPDRIIYDYNPEKARQLLAEAGYPNGFTTKLYVAQATPIIEAMCKYWRDVGINVELELTTVSVATKNLARKKLYGLVTFADGYGPDTTATWFESTISYDGVYALHGGDERVEQLVDKVKAEFDVEKRAEIIDEIIQIVWQDAWFVPLYEPVLIKAISAEWDYDQEAMPVLRSISLSHLSKRK